jgi:hypothetical protein
MFSQLPEKTQLGRDEVRQKYAQIFLTRFKRPGKLWFALINRYGCGILRLVPSEAPKRRRFFGNDGSGEPKVSPGVCSPSGTLCLRMWRKRYPPLDANFLEQW